jgi:hypothetical protein
LATIQELPGEEGKPGRLFHREVARLRIRAGGLRRRSTNRESRSGAGVTKYTISGRVRLPHGVGLGIITGARGDEYSGEIPFVIDQRSTPEGGFQVMDRYPNLTLAMCIGAERFAWLWQELRDRPDADLSVDLEFRAYRPEEEGRRPTYFLLDGPGDPLLAVGFRVEDPQAGATAERGRDPKLPTFRPGPVLARANNFILAACVAVGMILGFALKQFAA